VGGHGKQIDAEFFNISGICPAVCNRIGMKIDARFFCDLLISLIGWNGAHFIVSMHHRIMMVFPVIAFLLPEDQQTVTINREVGNLKSIFPRNLQDSSTA